MNDKPFSSGNLENNGSGQGERMRLAYSAAGEMLRSKLGREAPEDLEELQRVQAADLIVVKGSYDRVEQVLDAIKMPYSAIDSQRVDAINLGPEQLLMINCPGQISERGVAKVRDFVENGGNLFTTDWALKHVIEPAFPGTLAYNGRATADDVVRVELCDHQISYFEDLFEQGADPVWWLEGSSYPIKILDAQRVKVLVKSREMGEKYGDSPIAVQFEWGKGEVFHMTSHYYLQRSELRTARHAAKATAYAKEIGFNSASAGIAACLDSLTTAEVESAYSSAKLMSKLIIDKRRRNRQQER